MKHKMKKALCFLLVFLFLLPTFAVGAEKTKSEHDVLCDDILRYEMQKAGVDSLQDFVDTAMAKHPTAGAEWYLLALQKSDPTLDFSQYAEALIAHLETNRESSAATRKKLALVLLALGKGNHSFVNEVRNEEIAGQGVMSYVFALHLLNNGVSLRGYTAERLVQMLLDLVLEDGGWALNGKASDVDVTAMVLQALAPHKDREDVKTAIDKALVRLASLQKPDGDYSSYGVTNPESTAQVIMALTALGIDPPEDARFVQGEKSLLDGMMKYRLADGSFAHTESGAFNQNATVQVFCALTALSLRESLYDIGDFSSLPLLLETPTASENAPQNEKEGILVWKWYVLGGILLLSACLIVILWQKGKKGSAGLVFVTALLLAVLLFVIRIQTPDEYYRYEEPENPIGKVTFSIRCDTVAGRDGLPQDGVILTEESYSIAEGDSVYSLLLRVTKANQIAVATSGSYSKYVQGIDQLFEFSYGDTSGWTYTVNGKSPSVACDQYILQDGDVVEFSYTLTLGMVGES